MHEQVKHLVNLPVNLTLSPTDKLEAQTNLYFKTWSHQEKPNQELDHAAKEITSGVAITSLSRKYER
jgi:hypothetical protein